MPQLTFWPDLVLWAIPVGLEQDVGLVLLPCGRLQGTAGTVWVLCLTAIATPLTINLSMRIRSIALLLEPGSDNNAALYWSVEFW